VNRQPNDIAARLAALDPTRSFAVRAPAGSGKTELLTQRVLSLLAGCEKPEEILAITFTQKSAAEMRERILDALLLATHPVAPEKEHKRHTWNLGKKVLQRNEKQQWNLLENPGRLHIQTIDGFCRHLSRQQPVSSQLGTLPEALDDNQREQALLQSFRKTLRELSSNTPTARALTNILHHVDNNVSALESLVIGMLGKREQWLEHLVKLPNEDAMQSVNQRLVEDLLAKAYESLKPWHSELLGSFNHAFENLVNHEGKKSIELTQALKIFPPPSAYHLSAWRELVRFLLTNDNTIRKPGGLNVSVGIPADSKLKNNIKTLFEQLAEQPGLEDTLLMCRFAPDHPISATQLSLLSDIKTLLLHTVAQLHLTFNQMRATDFTQIALAALQSLGSEGEPSDLSLKLDYRIKHILVDEFQDTSLLQLKLLEKLTAGWQPDDGHTLFIVGDAMQSCYGFRKADVRIFLDVTKNGIGHVPLTPLLLTDNFRSESSIVNWNNQVFKNAFPEKEIINLSAVTYTASIAANPQQRSDAVQCTGFINKEDSTDEAIAIVNLIKAIQAKDPKETIAILVRSRNHAEQIIPCLKEAHIQWQATDMDRLDQRMAIIDLMSLTRAMLVPADRLAWLSLLRSPVVGLNLHDLYSLGLGQAIETDSTEASNIEMADIKKSKEALPMIFAINNETYYKKLSLHGQLVLNRIRQPIAQALQEQQRKPLRQWIEGLWYALGGAAATDPKQLNDCLHFFALLEKFDQQGQIPDWPAFESAIGRLYANDRVNDSTSDSIMPVNIMTIHKAKGLEFHHVILPGLAKSPRANRTELLLWNEYYLEHEQLLIMGMPAERGATEKDSHYQFLRHEQNKKDTYESARLLYVAATRAIKHLYLFASLKANDKNEISTPPPSSLLSCIWHDFETQAHWHGKNLPNESSLPPTTDTRDLPKLEFITRLTPSWKIPEFPHRNELSAWRGNHIDNNDIKNNEESIDKNIPELTSLQNFLARQTGIIIHYCLQEIVEQGLTTWNEKHIHHQYSHWRQKLQEVGVPERCMDPALQNIRIAIQTSLGSERGRWILDNTHEQSACELELIFNGKLLIIDRTFLYKEERWIIDYKTAMPANEQSIENFIQQQITLHKSQLENYKAIMQHTEKKPIRLALYFPLIDEFVII